LGLIVSEQPLISLIFLLIAIANNIWQGLHGNISLYGKNYPHDALPSYSQLAIG
jgi:hypothetical protein